jgi:Cu(I)/Ag(I) efflux system periplasmic protein CusF
MKRLVFAIVFTGALFTVSGYSNSANHSLKPAVRSSQAAAEMSEGEIRRVDREAKKITVRHGPLANLDMPAMTMVFQVKDEAMLDQVKVGEKVKFVAEKTDGAYTITKIQPAQ